MLDFAGFYGSGTAATMALYGAISAACLIAALLAHREQLRRA
jgi:hypothetical protein